MTTSGEPARLPKNYRLVYDIIRSAGQGVHFTMNDVFAHAKRRRPKIGFTTVYRGIQRLRDLGCIDEIDLPGTDSAVYELKGEPHAHFRCERCGKVEDVPFVLPARTIDALAARTGVTIDAAIVTLSGACRNCRV
jgi:Fur family peroxide stress response transcriptional regulator